MKPRPTEYRGVRFRSKNEAQVACLLDLQCQSAGFTRCWWYEPSFLIVDGYSPDFLVQKTEYDEDGVATDSSWKVIECKPAEVTDTYRAELADRFCKIIETPFVKAIRCAFKSVQCELWEGSVYGGHKNTWLFVGYGEDIPECVKQPFDDGLLNPWIEDADREIIQRYRFDLKEAFA